MTDCPKNLNDLCLVEKTAPPEIKWDVCNSCPVKKTVTLIGSRWSLKKSKIFYAPKSEILRAC